jgi:prepilin-type processing-associated H-X9-DG protein
MLPFTEQSPMYNSINFNLTSGNFENLTVSGVRLSTLTCPSDTKNDPVQIVQNATNASFNIYRGAAMPAGTWMQYYSSYAGNAGTWDFGSTTLDGSDVLAMYNGVIYNDSSTKISAVTDGTSNTFMFGEHSHAMAFLNDPYYYISDNSWQSGRWYDTLFSTEYPMTTNLQGSLAAANGPFGYYAITVANSLHPGGANFAYCDGSVKFIKNTIQSWTVSGNNQDSYGDAIPDGTTSAPSTVGNGTVFFLGSAQLGVYQKLSTRALGEVISADAY